MLPAQGDRPVIERPGAAAAPLPSEALAAAALALARRLAAGATLWCAAPRWPAHAAHISVEFLHPVIVGKRALPAAVVPGPDLAGSLRRLARSGDVVVMVGADDDPVLLDVARRAAAWGVTSIWLAAGRPGGAVGADHVIGLGDDVVAATHGGRSVLAYHLLWELTHVCFEHPGLLAGGAADACGGPGCITCADEGRVAEVTTVEVGGRATVRTPTGMEAADVSLVGDVRPGDLVLVHAGTAITRLDAPGHIDTDTPAKGLA